MSFDLPRKAVSLRFTGEVKALGPPEPKEKDKRALGQTRPKAPPTNRAVPKPATPPGSVAPPPLPQRKADVYAVEMQPTPYVGSRPSQRAEIAAAPTHLPAALAAKSPEIRVQLSSLPDDDEHVTEALDRGEMGLPSVLRNTPVPPHAPPSELSVAPAPAPKPNPWAHHRPPDATPPPEKAVVIPPSHRPSAPPSASSGGPLPLSAWIAIAIMAGIVSYTFAPAAFTSLERATGLVER